MKTMERVATVLFSERAFRSRTGSEGMKIQSTQSIKYVKERHSGHARGVKA